MDVSNSTDFNIRHGHLYPEGGEVTINFTVIPEKRIPPTGNDSTRVLIYVYNVGGTIPIHVYSYYDTDNNGHYNGLVLIQRELPACKGGDESQIPHLPV